MSRNSRTAIVKAWARVLMGLAPVFLFASIATAQFTAPYVVLQGTLTTASGTPAQNAVLTLTPSQVFFVAGSQVVVGPGQCYTDVSGSLHGLPTPNSGARVTPQSGVGTLPASNYYVKFAWYDQFGAITLTSPEVAVQLLATGELQILPPIGNGPPNAVGMKVYIGTTPGSETLQGATITTTAQYTQSVPLVTGANPPTQNLSSCAVVANDAGWPTGTGYFAALIDASGNPLFTYPEMWQLLSPGSTYNLANGIPYYHGQVTYPVPILTVPYNHNPQSISGPLSFSGYNIYNIAAVGVGTALPAWGVDVEGAGLLGLINAKGGYLLNGDGGTAGQCLLSDGTAYDTPANCLTSLPTIYYQTVAANGTNETQRLVLNFAPRFTLTDSSSPNRTTVDLNAPGSGNLVVTEVSNPGASTGCAQYDGLGNLGPTGLPCFNASGTYRDFYWTETAPCTSGSGNSVACQSGGSQLLATHLPANMPDASYQLTCSPDVDTFTIHPPAFTCGFINANDLQPVYSLPTTPGGTIYYQVMQILDNGGSGGSPVVYFHAHHN